MRRNKITSSKKRRNNKVSCHSDGECSTQKLYAMAVDRFFSGISDKDERFRILSKQEEIELIERLKDDRQELEK